MPLFQILDHDSDHLITAEVQRFGSGFGEGTGLSSELFQREGGMAQRLGPGLRV